MNYQHNRPRTCCNSNDSHNTFHATGTSTAAHERWTNNGRIATIVMSSAATATATKASSTSTTQSYDVPTPTLSDSGGGRFLLRKVSLTSHAAPAPAPAPAAVISSQYQKPVESNVVRNSILAGSISGIVSTIVLYPMDVIRTKMQAEGSIGGGGAHHHRGPLQVVRHTIHHGGFRALYTGMTLPLAAQAVYKGTVFSVNNVAQQYIVDCKTLDNYKKTTTGSFSTSTSTAGKLTMLDRFYCGSVAGAVNGALFVTPVEFVRNQMIAQHSKLAEGHQSSRLAMGNWDFIRNCIKNHGIFSLWRGVGMTIARDGIGVGCFFYVMKWTEQQLTPPDQAPSVASTLISGAVAGLAYWVSSLPLDTIKTWQQSADLSTRFSVTDSIQKIYRESGLIGLAQRLQRGWQVAYFRGMPSAAITYSVYSFAYRHLQHSE